MEKDLSTFFEGFLKKESLFFDKKALQASFVPETINHREEQKKQVANILAPSLKLEKPSNLFVYGKTGSGKTLTIRHTTNKLMEISKKNDIPLKIIYLNCKLKKIADTEYRLIAQLSREFGKSIPPTGLPTDEVYKIFFNALDEEKRMVLVILDEIDQLIKKTGDEILYSLVRINEELKNTQLSLIGISNDLVFVDALDPRIKSSLSEEEVVFPPYNALQIQDILRQRAKLAFKPDLLDDGVVEKCAAYAAREHGDARRAIELLRVAAEIAERNGSQKITTGHIDESEEKIERDRVTDIVLAQPKQSQLALYAILSSYTKRKNTLFTGEIYEIYKNSCYKIGLSPLTQRRISDIVAELDMFGIINANVISKGRYGRTREISLAIPPAAIPKLRKTLEEGLDLA